MAKPSMSLPRPAPPPPPIEEVYPPIAPLPRPWREPSPASATRIPLSYAAFGPGVTAGGKTFEEARAEWKGCEDLTYDVALGCVTLGPHLVPLANVRAMVRAGSGT